MLLGTFLVHIPPESRELFDLDEVRSSLRHRFSEHGVLRVQSIPNRSSGEFAINVEFAEGTPDEVVTDHLIRVIGDLVPGAEVRPEGVDTSKPARPVLSRPQRPAPGSPGSGTPGRYVNTLIALTGSDEPLSADRPLASAEDYEVLLGIGHQAAGSLLAMEDARWPEEQLPDEGLWLRAALTQDGRPDAIVRPFFLPRNGESFSCDCLPGGEHAENCAERPWVRLPLRTPMEPRILRLELVIYYQAAAVHVQQLVLPAGETMTGGPQAHLIGRLTRTFNDLGKLAGRAASIVVSDATSRIIVNAVGFAGSAFSITAEAADTSARNARQLLYDSHFEVRKGREYTRYGINYEKQAVDFWGDLRLLAREGAELYTRLFGGNPAQAASLPHLLRHEAETRERPPVIQVIDGQYSEHSMLWALVYDIPLGGDVRKYELCPSVHDFGPGSEPIEGIPPACPMGREHLDRRNVLCPFGFWGLSAIIEQPPDAGRDLETAVLPDQQPLSFLIVPDSSLDVRLTGQHLQRLDARLPQRSVSRPSLVTEEDLIQALEPESMDVVYFYCHSGYERRSLRGSVSSYLNLGDYWIAPLDVTSWVRTWPDPHWPRRHPLVVLNGCHTTEATSGTLNSFVPAFTQWAAASGVLGTEVTVEQGLAGWAMEMMLASLAAGATVGEAVRELRWAMLRQGNVMGFAYTPYCLANLTLRDQ